MFQLILPFQLELPFDGPDAARGTAGAARVRRARVRGAKGGPANELGHATAMPTADASARASVAE